MVAVAAILLATIFLAPVPIPALAFSDPSPPSGSAKETKAKAPWNATYTDFLKRTLLVGYDKFARPSHHQLTTNVSLGLSVYHVDLDDLSGVMTVHGWVKLAWNDEKLKWNSSEFGGLRNLHVADHEIWQPDIVQYNSASGNTVDQFGNTHCIVSENGSVIWVPPAKLTSFCTMDLRRWPQDEQICNFTFGSWTYDGIQINIETSDLYDLESNNDYLIESGEWEMINISQQRYEKFYSCCPDAPYVSVDYAVHVRRRGGGSLRSALMRTPAAVSTLMALLSHCLPPSSPRLPLAAAPPTLLSIALLYLGHRLPASMYTPNIVMFYSICLYLTCLSGVVSVIVINMVLSRRALPWNIRRALSSRAVKCLRLPKIEENSTSEELQNTIGGGSGIGVAEEGARILSGSPAPARDWLALATAIDRIVFIIILIIFVIVSIVYSC
ncbi:acetylcholine receptor subunit alpha-like 1 isoform X2 [Arctopsyche grandis]